MDLIAASSLRPMRRMRISSAPARTSKAQPSPRRTIGIGSAPAVVQHQPGTRPVALDAMALGPRGQEIRAVLFGQRVERHQPPIVRTEHDADLRRRRGARGRRPERRPRPPAWGRPSALSRRAVASERRDEQRCACPRPRAHVAGGIRAPTLCRRQTPACADRLLRRPGRRGAGLHVAGARRRAGASPCQARRAAIDLLTRLGGIPGAAQGVVAVDRGDPVLHLIAPVDGGGAVLDLARSTSPRGSGSGRGRRCRPIAHAVGGAGSLRQPAAVDVAPRAAVPSAGRRDSASSSPARGRAARRARGNRRARGRRRRAGCSDRAWPRRDRARPGDCGRRAARLTSRSRESIRRLTLMVFQRLTLMLTSRRRQWTPPHREFDTRMPTPHQIPTCGRPNSAPAPARRRREEERRKRRMPPRAEHPDGVVDRHEHDLRIGRDDGDDLRGRRRRVHHDHLRRRRRGLDRDDLVLVGLRGCPPPSPSRAGTAPSPSPRRAGRGTRRPGCAPIRGFSPSIASTCGNATSDCTLGSHGLSRTASPPRHPRAGGARTPNPPPAPRPRDRWTPSAPATTGRPETARSARASGRARPR